MGMRTRECGYEEVGNCNAREREKENKGALFSISRRWKGHAEQMECVCLNACVFAVCEEIRAQKKKKAYSTLALTRLSPIPSSTPHSPIAMGMCCSLEGVFLGI